MILLSPEEIEELSKWWLDAAEEVDWATTVAKAQLKQLHRWGEELCYDHNGEQRKELGLFVKRHECPICWQALKKEVDSCKNG